MPTQISAIRPNIDGDTITSVSLFEREVFTGEDGATVQGDLVETIDTDPAHIATLTSWYMGAGKATARAQARRAKREAAAAAAAAAKVPKD